MVFWQFRGQKGPVNKKLREYVECPVIKGNSWSKYGGVPLLDLEYPVRNGNSHGVSSNQGEFLETAL